ncbi:MAG: hypothetical protein QXW71_00100 [Thermoplasmata archaeon]
MEIDRKQFGYDFGSKLNVDKVHLYPVKNGYSDFDKMIDILKLSSVPKSRNIHVYKQIIKKAERQKNIKNKLQLLKLNRFDEHIFLASQTNKGIITKDVIEKYADENIKSEEIRNIFKSYAGKRLSYLAYLNLLNEIPQKDNKILFKRVYISKKEVLKQKQNIEKLDYKYEVTTKFFRYLEEYLKQKQLTNEKTYKREETVEFIPAKNHKHLLKFAQGGILNFAEVEQHISTLAKNVQKRELRMKTGMLIKLVKAGYLEDLGGKLYRLTDKAQAFMEGRLNKEDLKDAVKQAKRLKELQGVKVTKFDITNIVEHAYNNRLYKKTIDELPKKDSIKKRIETLKEAKLITEHDEYYEFTPQFLDRVRVKKQILLENKINLRRHSLDCLTAEQKTVLRDLKDFLNITQEQMLKYIYNGNEKIFRSDINYLINKKIIQKHHNGIYVLTTQGTTLTAELTGDERIFRSKILSRPEEMRHDVLIYTAFKELEKELISQGKKITAIKNERQLKSEDMITFGKEREQYPDLYIEFADEKTGDKDFRNIEIDICYDDLTIKSKLSINKLIWFTASKRQKEKVLKKAKYMDVRIIDDILNMRRK